MHIVWHGRVSTETAESTLARMIIYRAYAQRRQVLRTFHEFQFRSDRTTEQSAQALQIASAAFEETSQLIANGDHIRRWQILTVSRTGRADIT